MGGVKLHKETKQLRRSEKVKTEKDALVLYHITERINAEQIKKEGIKPSIGFHSRMSGETEPFVFLCDYASIPYWMLILRMEDPVLVRVHISPEETDMEDTAEEVQEQGYSYYKEYLCQKYILPKDIRIMKVPKKVRERLVEANRDLCTSYVYSFANLCLRYARYYNDPDEETRVFLQNMTETTLFTARGLDFQSMPEAELRDAIRNSGDGGYAFTDHYCNTRKRMWSQLPCYQKDSLEKVRMELFWFIRDTFRKFLYLETGGWCNDV